MNLVGLVGEYTGLSFKSNCTSLIDDDFHPTEP